MHGNPLGSGLGCGGTFHTVLIPHPILGEADKLRAPGLWEALDLLSSGDVGRRETSVCGGRKLSGALSGTNYDQAREAVILPDSILRCPGRYLGRRRGMCLETEVSRESVCPVGRVTI